MYESVNGPYRPSQSVWFAVLAVALGLTAAALLGACGGPQDSAAAEEIRSDRERAVPPAGNAAFAFDL